MELLGLCVLLVVLAIITVVGHGIWLLVAAVWRSLSGGSPPPPLRGSLAEDRPASCVRCGTPLAATQPRCPKCRLHRDSPTAAELRELLATARQLQRFLDQGVLDRPTCDRLYQCIEARQQALMAGEPAAGPAPSEPSPVEELERLLVPCADVRNLTLGNRQRALACYRRCSAEQLAALSVPAQLSLARLLQLAGLISRSLQGYRQLLQGHPDLPDFAATALEAARCAERHHEAEQACWFLEQALARPLAPAQRREAEQLLAQCRPPQEEILEVLPVEPAPREVGRPRAPSGALEAEGAARLAAPPVAAREESPRRPRRSLGEVLAAFMEERNILWGELVGGLLIVGCSIALVISLWQTLEQIPYFPFVIFALVTSALFGAGLYTLHRWKLQSTSQGLLVISMLLVPLNFLVLAGLSKGRAGGLLEVGVEVVSWAAFAWLVSRAARVVANPELLPGVPQGHWLLALAVMGPSGAQLLVPRLVDLQQPAPWLFYLVALLPVACHGLPVAAALRDTPRPLRDAAANALFAFLGIATFALAVALGFLVYWSEDIGLVLNRLAVLVALAAVAPLAVGMVVQRSAEVSAPVRTGGTAVALAAATVMLLAVALAWPQPPALIAVCLLDFAVLTAVALLARLPLFHAAALPCLAGGWLTAFHLAAGNLDVPAAALGTRLLHQAFSSTSGAALVPLVVLVAVAAELLTRLGRAEHSPYYAIGSAVGAVGSLILVSLHGTAEPGQAALAYGVYGLGCLMMNVRRRWWQLSYVGAALTLVCFLFLALHWQTDLLSLRWRQLLALLTHAVLFLALSLGLAGRLFEPPLNNGPSLGAIFAVPFRRAALASTLLALPLLLVVERGGPGWRTGYVSAVALIWLVISVAERWPALFAAFQAAASAAVLLGVTTWLRRHGWVGVYPADLLALRCQHAYGVGLGLLGLLWAALRLRLAPNTLAQRLLEPPWPAVDRVLLAAVVGWQLLLAVLGVLPGVLSEFVPTDWRPIYTDWAAQAHGPGAWLVVGILAVVLIVSLWDRRPADAILELVLLAMTVPVLMAGRFGDELATASALRWGLAACFLVASLPLWLREPLRRWLGRVGIRPDEQQGVAVPARWLLIVGCVAPVLILTMVLAVMGFSGQRPVGPLPGTFFRDIGFLPRHLVPLGLISLTLVGHALRERSAGYAFAAGLIADATLTGGYALNVVLSGGQLGSAERVRLLQLGAGGASAWAIGWLGLSAGAGGISPLSSAGWWLRLAQVGIGNALLTVLLFSATLLLVAPIPALDPGSTVVGYPAGLPWTTEAGAAWSWLALALAVAATVLYALERERPGIPTDVIALAAVGCVALLACTVERLAPTRGYRTLMVGLAVLSLAEALALGRLRAPAVRRIVSASESWLKEVGLPVVAALPALCLAIKAAGLHQDQLWAALTSFLLAGTAATLAYQRRQEAWAFAAGLCASFAVALFVWRIHRGDPLADWWVYLVQAKVITLAGAGLLWLAERRRVYEQELTAWSSPLLALQLALALLGNLALLLPALGWLVAAPGGTRPAYTLQPGELGGWLGLALTAAAIVWYVRLTGIISVVHVAGLSGLLLGIVAACLAGRWDRGTWLSHHVLTVAWSALGLALLVAAWTGAAVRRLGPAFWSDERRARAAELLAALFPARPTRRWVEVLGLLVVLLALRGAWNDPARPYWSSAAVLGVSAAAGALAVWSRRPGYVYASGLLLNVVGMLAWQAWLVDEVGIVTWLAWGPGILNGFLAVHALCLAIASAFWAALELALRRRTPPIDLRGGAPPFPHVAALAAVQLLAVLILGGIASDLTDTGVHAGGTLTWVALLATIAAIALGLGDEQAAGWARPGLQLYEAGLLTVGLLLHGAALEPRWLCWNAALALAGLVLLAAVLAWSVPRLVRHWQRLRLPAETAAGPGPWFAPLQLLVGLLAVALSVWMSLDFATVPQRLAGPLAAALLLPAGLLATDRRRPLGDPQFARRATLLLGVVATAELFWSFLDPSVPAPWLHRNVLLMVALALLAVVYGIVLERLLGGYGPWARAAKRMGPLLGAGAFALLAVVLVQEFALYDPATRHPPMRLPFVIVVAVALLILTAGSLGFAVLPGRDPFDLSERGRTLYVYAAEVLLVLTLVHLRLNVPDWIPPIFGQYWPLVIMALAFLGVGLGELFERRGRRVLAEPLRRTGVFLPLLPVVAYLLRPLSELQQALGSAVPGAQPLLRYLERLPAGYGMHAAVWFLLGGLYTLIALTRRSSRYALLAALAANFGLWVVLAHQEGTGFLAHPQFWLVPLALILLVAEHVNRDRLAPAQAGALRYAALLVLYLSSTADMFIAGLGRSVAWPLALALLSIGGVLAGIVLRVRAFLYLGVAFLFLVIFAQIWHAAVDRQQTWVWWASGIALGAAILALFAVFEKRRNDVLKLVDEIKRWD